MIRNRSPLYCYLIVLTEHFTTITIFLLTPIYPSNPRNISKKKSHFQTKLKGFHPRNGLRSKSNCYTALEAEAAELRCRADDDEESGRGIGEDKEIKTSLVDVTEAGVYLVQNDHTAPLLRNTTIHKYLINGHCLRHDIWVKEILYISSRLGNIWWFAALAKKRSFYYTINLAWIHLLS